jgi:hypothetical protein
MFGILQWEIAIYLVMLFSQLGHVAFSPKFLVQ